MKKKKYWCNNGSAEIQVDIDNDIPDGYQKGRLPVSAETRKKHSENNGIYKLTQKQRKERADKISKTANSRTEEEKLEHSQKVSQGRKGKGKGNIPWNKGKKGVQVAWNKGLKCPKSKEATAHMIETRIETQKKNGTLGKNQDTSIELNYYNELLKKYLPEDIYHPFFDKERYPYKCDFYIKSEDLFIELHGNWTHGGKPYNPDDIECQTKLNIWQKKAQTSDYYKNAIYTWTDLDVRKKEIAEKNNLNIKFIYPN